ncbi:hypothetical protein B0H19DRAFT_159844 [Mycena capillaripes]|nr:hypothetical protein B0H19DRAFT_159844 [Mycena capillaripes]
MRALPLAVMGNGLVAFLISAAARRNEDAVEPRRWAKARYIRLRVIAIRVTHLLPIPGALHRGRRHRQRRWERHYCPTAHPPQAAPDPRSTAGEPQCRTSISPSADVGGSDTGSAHEEGNVKGLTAGWMDDASGARSILILALEFWGGDYPLRGCLAIPATETRRQLAPASLRTICVRESGVAL